MSRNRLGPRGVRALLASPHLAGVETLDLSHNPPATAWLPDLLASVRNVRVLLLRSNRLRPAAARLIAGDPGLAGVRGLYLEGNPIGDRGAAALARSEHVRGLRRLHLSACGVRDAGAAALARPDALPNLLGGHALWLMRNDYGPAAAEALRERLGYDPARYS